MGNNITIPYSGHIPGGIHHGTDVVISGRVAHGCNRFSINLCNGPTYDSGCALHFNPRFDQNQVVRTHLQDGNWGPEEKAGGFPFKRGHVFEIHLKATHHGYNILVNNRHFCDFNHRIAKESIQYIYIEGEVVIHFIQFRGNQGGGGYAPAPSYPPAPVPGYPPAPVPGYPPAPVPGYPPAPAYPSMGGAPIYNPPVPFTTPIQGGIVPGKIVYISGIPNSNPSRFTVNLQCGPYESGDFAMHFDVRFNYGDSYNKIVRTHKQGGNYGNEETTLGHFPFFPNTPFEMMILIEPTSFKIAVNNQHLLEFFHRIHPFNRADHVSIVGDVRLTQVRFQ